MNIARMFEYRPGAPRYVIIGNRVNGYQGVERHMAVDLKENETEDTCWSTALFLKTSVNVYCSN